MPSPAFIVEGRMEQRLIGRLCPGQPIRRINCNGDNVEISRMCDFIETQIRTLGNRHYPILILFDREQRQSEADAIEREVLDILRERGLEDHDIRVFVADREAEDWYLLDTQGICAHFNLKPPSKALKGKGGLAKLLSPVVDYHETSIGVELFGIVSKGVIAAGSPSFKSLLETAIEIGCSFARDPNLI